MFAVAVKADDLHKQGINGSVGVGFRARDGAFFLVEAGVPAALRAPAAPGDGSLERFRNNIVRVFCYR
jgi:hypothetical protein